MPCPPTLRTCTQQRNETAQATVELLAFVPVLVLLGAIAVQAFLLALTVVFGQAAAHAAARAPQRAAEATVVRSLPIPAAWRSGTSISFTASRVSVSCTVPAVLPLAPQLRISASSALPTPKSARR